MRRGGPDIGKISSSMYMQLSVLREKDVLMWNVGRCFFFNCLDCQLFGLRLTEILEENVIKGELLKNDSFLVIPILCRVI